MTAKPVPPPNSASDLVFVRAYHNLTGISEGEWVDYYSSASLNRLREDLARYVEHHLDLFSKSYDYEDCFSLAEYGDPDDVLWEDEVAVFRSALSAEDRESPVDELPPRAVLRGYRAVILQRFAKGDLAAIRSAAELFNGMIESAIEGVDDRNPRCYIGIETAKEFGPGFVESLLGSIQRTGHACRHDDFDRFIGDQFEPLQPLLETLLPTVQHEGWPHNDLSLGRLLLIVDFFKKVVEEDWQF